MCLDLQEATSSVDSAGTKIKKEMRQYSKDEGYAVIYTRCPKKVSHVQLKLEYNIILPTIERTGRKPCCIIEQIIGIVMASGRDFNNVTCVLSCNLYAL